MKSKDIVFAVGATLVLVGTALGVFRIPFAVWLLGAGAVVVFILRFAFPERSEDFRVRRLERMRFFSSLFLLAGAYYLYKESGMWIVWLLVASVFEGVAAFRHPKD